MKTIGIYTVHDQSVAVSQDGVITHAMEEERPSRKKHYGQEHGATPALSLEWLASQGHSLGSANVIAQPTPTLDFSEMERHGLGKRESIVPRHKVFDHHLCHIATAYYWSGWDDCYVLAVDGGGTNWFGQTAHCHDGKIDILGGEPMTEKRTLEGTNPGTLYLHMTMHLGFKAVRDEGKVMCLAAKGDPSRFRSLFDRYEVAPFKVMDRLNRGIITNEEVWAAVGGKDAAQSGQIRADLAASVQELFERMILADVEAFVPRGARLALSGGSFANVVVNRKILDWAGEVWVAPPMNDGGVATGAAMLADPDTKPYRLHDAYLGLDVGTPTADPREVAKTVADGLMVGIAHGRCEHGPRALGNRTILADPRREDTVGCLNKKLRRSGFMPFAPVMLYEFADEILEPAWRRAEHAAEFMTMAFCANPGWKEKIPAVVHVDGTCRPQVIKQDVNPWYWSVLEEFRKLTNCPVLLNTSFNMHEEPIVTTLADAASVLERGGVDVLVTPEGAGTK